MKKQLVFLFLLSIVTFSAYSQETRPHLKIGGGLGLGDWASTDDGWEEKWGAGANIRALIYSDNIRFSLSPSYIYFPVPKFNYDFSYSSYSSAVEVDPAMHYINVEARYSFVKSQKVESYVFVGPSFLIYSEDISYSGSYADFTSDGNQFKTGAIAGLGINFNFSGSVGAYADCGYSYIADDWDQVLVSVGVLFRIF